jgi:hypothetical protein
MEEALCNGVGVVEHQKQAQLPAGGGQKADMPRARPFDEHVLHQDHPPS